MKICKQCQQNKPLDQFRRDKYTSDGLSYKCKSCLSNYDKQIYKTRTVKVKISTTVRRTANAVRIQQYKAERGCNRCIERDPLCLDLHHPDNNKEFTVGNGVHYKWERILSELIKCEVLCANCHRKHHANKNVDIDNEIKDK